MKRRGFTIVELLTVMSVIVLLLSILTPALHAVRKVARKTKQRAALRTIGTALDLFHGDYDEYPPSEYTGDLAVGYSSSYGANKLAEALFGYDLMGFHLQTNWLAGGSVYSPDNTSERRGPYLDKSRATVVTSGGVFGPSPQIDSQSPLICDVFGSLAKISTPQGTVRAGPPVLYYRANARSFTISDPAAYEARQYNMTDNLNLIALVDIAQDGALGQHPLGDLTGDVFYGDPMASPRIWGYIEDPTVAAARIAYRRDSFLLVTAGPDGQYGTRDDIKNFGP